MVALKTMSEEEQTDKCITQREAEDDFELGCSDEEKYGLKDPMDDWEPSPDEIVELYEQIERDKILELEWQCPGRRPPTPVNVTDNQNNQDENSSETKEEENSDFDFKDEMSQLRLSVRPTGEHVGPRGSAKKKTTSLDAILSNMARHRKLDMMDHSEDEHQTL